MKKLTVIAAAFAAAMASFAHVETAAAQSSAAAGKETRTAKAAKSEEKCQYLFSCNQVDARQKNAKAVAEAPKPKPEPRLKAVKADAKRKAPRVKAVLKKDGKAVDLVTTASIGGKGGKVIKAVAAGSGPYHSIIARYAGEYGVPVSLAHAVIHVESGYRPNTTGSAGEVGLMQIKPATARMMGYGGSAKGLYNPETNIKFGMKYLAMAQKLGGGTTCGTILKYNAGHGAKRMNPVSSAYCAKVKRRLGA